ncbi:hypothetical protein [Catellatospora tritici]|uniref:hypothetical protein n=1 Tax=Catellatospora tritici TaxID=2851566 RepID=UPI001C2DC3A1|nr:hypothetical protein [Catellatospora tritici]MBV1855345.1 hypothetical protein [Catellatospora tritici]
MTVDDLRTRLTEEYGEERFTMTVIEIEQRAGTGARRRMAAWAMAGVAALVAVAFLVWPTGGSGVVEPLTSPSVEPTATGTPAWHAAFPQACAQQWAKQDRGGLAPGLRDNLPPLRFDVAQGRLGMLVYATADTSLIVECIHDDDGTHLGLTTPAPPARRLLTDVGAGMPRYGVSSLADENGGRHAADYYLGLAPAGTREVEAHTARGEVFPGLVDGDLFLVWAPEGGLRDAVMRAFTGDRMIMVGGLGHVDGTYQEQALVEACRRTAAPFGDLGFPDLPPVRFKLRSGEDAVHLYGDEHLMVACERSGGESGGGAGIAVTEVAALEDPSSIWHPMQFNHADEGDRGWLLGRAPDGAVSGTAVMKSGKTVALTVSGGWFGAWWRSADGTSEHPASIEIVTRTEVWQWKGGTVTHRPR